MENALKTKYTTRELKKDIIENSEVILENRERIRNVEACVTEFGNHIQRHGDVLDPQLMRHDVILFGKDGDNGLVRQIDKLSGTLSDCMGKLEKIESGINKLLWAVILAVVGAVLKLVIFQ